MKKFSILLSFFILNYKGIREEVEGSWDERALNKWNQGEIIEI